MSTVITRQLIRLRLTLVGHIPEIWREVDIDQSMCLADLRRVITSLFEGLDCRHHVFVDHGGTAASMRGRRRWGDRWTMIDLRDPSIIDEATARIGSVLGDGGALTFGRTCRAEGLVEIEVLEDAWVVADSSSSAAGVAIVRAGGRRAPLPCCRGPLEHAALVAVLADTAHPAHDDLVECLASTLGPWRHFDAEEFDPTAAQRILDRFAPPRKASRGDSAPRRWGALDHLTERLPRLARVGFDAHVAESGLDLPAVITVDEARATTEGFRWIITSASDGGISVGGGAADPEVVRAGSAALACDEQHVLRLITLARRGRLLYVRGGRLHANQRAIAAANAPMDLWSLLARDLVRAHLRSTAGYLLLLAIADGSLGDREIGARHAVRVMASIAEQRSYARWSYDAVPDECEWDCDCPSVRGETWHEVVTRAVRQAAFDAAGEEAQPVIASTGEGMAEECGFPADWLGPTRSRHTQQSGLAPGDGTSVDESTVLAAAAELIELLGLFGLNRSDDGHWTVPSALRELAREALRSPTNPYDSRF